MTMTIKRLLVLFLFISGAVIADSQEKDFGLWFNAAAEKEIVNNLDFGADLSLRTYHNTSQVEEGFIDLGLSYKINKVISAGLSYRYTRFREDDESYHTRHKWFADLRVKTSLGDIDISGRIRFQQRFKTYFEDENDRESKEHLRLRLKALYDIPSFPVNPYLAAEIYMPIFEVASRTIDKQRFFGGFEYNLSKKQSIELEYIFQRDYFPDLADINIISINYSIKL